MLLNTLLACLLFITGYRGRLEVNGLTFTGERVCLNKKLAHQEVAKKAMDHLQTLAASAGEGGQMRPAAAPSESSTSEGDYHDWLAVQMQIIEISGTSTNIADIQVDVQTLNFILLLTFK